MGKLTLEFALDEEIVHLDSGTLYVSLGNGVNLKTSVPAWVERVRDTTLTLTLEVDGEPPYAEPGQTPIERVHETPVDRGLEVGQDGGSGPTSNEVQTKDTGL